MTAYQHHTSCLGAQRQQNSHSCSQLIPELGHKVTSSMHGSTTVHLYTNHPAPSCQDLEYSCNCTYEHFLTMICHKSIAGVVSIHRFLFIRHKNLTQDIPKLSHPATVLQLTIQEVKLKPSTVKNCLRVPYLKVDENFSEVCQ